MKTMLIMVATYAATKDATDDLKSQIVEYLGTKMLENRLSNTPHLELNTVLPQEDKKWITQLAEKHFGNPGGTVLFFEYEEQISSDEVTTVVIKKEPEYE